MKEHKDAWGSAYVPAIRSLLGWAPRVPTFLACPVPELAEGERAASEAKRGQEGKRREPDNAREVF